MSYGDPGDVDYERLVGVGLFLVWAICIVIATEVFLLGGM